MIFAAALCSSPSLLPGMSTISPLHRAFLWPDVVVQALCFALSPSVLAGTLLCTGFSATSFFSGLGTSDIAWLAIGSALLRRGLPFVLQSTFAVDSDAVCRRALLAGAAQCVFADVFDFFRGGAPGCYSWGIATHAWCYRHGRYCPIRPGTCEPTSIIGCLASPAGPAPSSALRPEWYRYGD